MLSGFVNLLCIREGEPHPTTKFIPGAMISIATKEEVYMNHRAARFWSTMTACNFGTQFVRRMTSPHQQIEVIDCTCVPDYPNSNRFMKCLVLPCT